MPDATAVDMLVKLADKPALSATSDMPVKAENLPVDSANEQVNDNDQAAPKGDKPEDSANSEKNSGSDAAANAEHGAKPSKGVQKRIDELTRQRGEAERFANEQSKRLDKALELVEKLTGSRSEQQPAAQADDNRPARAQFEDPDAYTEALSAWSGRQAVKAYQLEQQQANVQTKQQEVFQKTTKTWTDGREKAIEKYPDYVEVAENPDVPISEHVGFAIITNEKAHDIAYWLGKHPEEASRISALPPVVAAMEIGAIGERLSQAKPEVSKAPAPVKPIGSRNEATSRTPDQESMEEYAARRKEELRNARKRQ